MKNQNYTQILKKLKPNIMKAEKHDQQNKQTLFSKRPPKRVKNVKKPFY